MPLEYRKTLTISAASTNGVAASQTPSGAGDLTLASSTVTLPNTGQRPQIVTLANLSNRTITIYGTDYAGQSQSIAFTGPNATNYEVPLTFYTITRVAISGAAAGAFSVGWAASADTPPLPLDVIGAPTDISFGCVVVSGSPTFTVYLTMDKVLYGSSDPGLWTWFAHPIVTGQTTSQTGNFGKPVTACKLYATGESVMTFTVLQGTAMG